MALDKLVIVESPTKARTIGRMLGNEYRIMASMGHIRDLPENSLGVDIQHDFTPQYVESKRSGKTIKELRSLAKDAEAIYLAPDPDREGEAIAWHLRELLSKSAKCEFHRVTFHEITKSAIARAFQETSEVNMDLVDSQQARRVLDRLVGYMISPLLWSKIEKGISAGRVQSVALRIICEREREITSFEPKEYWNFDADFEARSLGSGDLFPSKLVKIDGKKLEAGCKEESDKILAALKDSGNFKISLVETKPRNRYAPPPFITSTLQQAASNSMGFSASFTMRVAQQLYEGVEIGSGGSTGLITYMRTDSVNIAAEARESCRRFIASEIGPEFVPERPNFFKSKSSAQEAHEAIRPTEITNTPEKLKPFLSSEQYRLYSLIWRRFTASQMSPALQHQTTVETETAGKDSRNYTFRTVATVLSFPGFLKVYRPEEQQKKQENEMPAFLAELKPGTECFLKDIRTEQKFTEPPPRYSEATLIRELETNGIGRPSTYASIINTILKRNYVSREKGRLHPSELGFKVNDFLIKSIPQLFEIGFTANMESKLDIIEEGRLKWTDMLSDFYENFSSWLEKAKHADSPEQEKPKALIELLDNVKNWEPPVKRGRRTYNDNKFFNSVRDKFESGSQVTANQWQALLNLAVKYSNELPGLSDAAEKYGFTKELEDAGEKLKEAKERRENSKASDETVEKYSEIFSSFANVEWEQPDPKKSRQIGDEKFFMSLKKQAESGKILSEKQINAISRMALKYKDRIQDFEKLARLLEINLSENAEAQSSGPAPASEGIKEIMEALSKMREWAEPVKKGRRVYDDKAFFESLEKQYNSGKQLSPRQEAALKKIASKYKISPQG